MADTDPLPDALEHLIPAAPVDGRPRLVDFGFSRTKAGLCCADVVLEDGSGQRWQGRAHGSSSPTGEMRVAAESVLRALEQGRGSRLELLGVKSLRAFDAMVVIVAVAADRDGVTTRLLGCALAGDDLNRGAVLAALNATNRVLRAGTRQ